MLDLSQPRHIHVIGVGGVGMSAIAEVLATMGHCVTGSDAAELPVYARLRAAGVDVHAGWHPSHVEGADAVVVSTAWLDGVEARAAGERGLTVARRAAALAAISSQRRTIAVAGTHGKTTTSAMLATILVHAGRRPSFVVGGQLAEFGTGARWDDGEWFVVEADESDGTFLELPAEVAVVTSVEADHLEHWGGFDALVAAFEAFIRSSAVAVVCADDEAARAAAARAAIARGADVGGGTGRGADAGRVTTYGFSAAAATPILSYEGHADGSVVETSEGRLTVPIPGRHNALNALAAVTAAGVAGVPFDEAAAALARFGGVGRRFERRGERAGVVYVDDYAHLPGEVRAALGAAADGRCDGRWRRVVCVFQPHRYSRTAALGREFATAFEGADIVAVTDVYGAGEPVRPGVTGKIVVDAVAEAEPGRRLLWLPGRDGLVGFLRRELRAGDLCLTLGAGDLTTLPDELLAG